MISKSYYNYHLKTLVISDTHLDNKFEQKKFDFLAHLFLRFDQIILNGDFWDGYLCSFESFINSPWKNLFPILKSKNTIYIYGNHDPQNTANSKTSLFSQIQTHHYKLKHKDKNIDIMHGHQIVKTFDLNLSLPLKKKIFHTADLTYNIMTKMMKEKFWEMLMERYTHKFYEYIEKENVDCLICGHTHCPSQKKDNFINSGMVNYGIAHYVEIEDEIRLIKTKY